MIPKFRFYNFKLNKIYEVVSIDYLNEQVDCILPEMNGDIFNWDWNVGALLQSSGIEDIHGNEFYDKDIARDVDSEELGVIEYSSGSFVIKFLGGDSVSLYDVQEIFEVISNQFEHPHLLEE